MIDAVSVMPGTAGAETGMAYIEIESDLDHVRQCQGLQSIPEVFFRKNPTN